MSGPEEPRRPDRPQRGPLGRMIPDPHAAKRSMAAAYQGAIEAVLAMAVSALAGWWIDGRLGTGPWGLFVGMAVGFAALLLRLLRIRSPALGRAFPERWEQPPDDRDPGWADVLRPGREDDSDEESGGPPETK
jgi:hypothetical protein